MKSTPFLIPANCFNRVRLLQLRSEGSLEFGLPGLPGHHMVLRAGITGNAGTVPCAPC
ncbi:hypothetical protein [endosymbiont of unidentified scaly snail isolate Monju]|uniref:hypothetical protein n=1 Tax=endosymbiont of unidentified scaly snail isolate Monju TaxID=1248727 RepID=UPI00149429A0|nr:hypothetical protein [endosymbiont of unidentified scaly snail isolate Monju]